MTVTLMGCITLGGLVREAGVRHPKKVGGARGAAVHGKGGTGEADLAGTCCILYGVHLFWLIIPVMPAMDLVVDMLCFPELCKLLEE